MRGTCVKGCPDPQMTYFTYKVYRNLIDFLIGLNLQHNKHRIKNLTTLSGTTEERIAKMKETIFG